MPISTEKSNSKIDGLESLINEAINTKPTPSPIADKTIEESKRRSEQVKTDQKSDGQPIPINRGVFEQQKSTNESDDSGRPFARDSKGNFFDPNLHTTDDEGNPKLNNDGTFRKKRGRKSGGANIAGSGTKRAAALEAGRATAEAMFAIGVALGGEEWEPIVKPEIGINEPQQITAAWAGYFEATGKTDVPPWAAVAIACGSYALIRFRMPKTQSRFKRFTGWVKYKIFEYKNNRKNRKGK